MVAGAAVVPVLGDSAVTSEVTGLGAGEVVATEDLGTSVVAAVLGDGVEASGADLLVACRSASALLILPSTSTRFGAFGDARRYER